MRVVDHDVVAKSEFVSYEEKKMSNERRNSRSAKQKSTEFGIN